MELEKKALSVEDIKLIIDKCIVEALSTYKAYNTEKLAQAIHSALPAQQPDDDIKHGMAFWDKSIEQEVVDLVHDTFGGAEYYNNFIPKLLAILEKRKEQK